MYKYLAFSISITISSWIVGFILNSFLRKTELYNKKLLSLSFIKSKKLNRIFGLDLFKWIVKNTFFKFFNQKLKLKKKVEKMDLEKLRNEMTNSEIDHLIAFGLVNILVLVMFYNSNYLFSFTIMVVNVLMNLYPTLLQQANKRRIDQLIKKL